jgi:hypothetical protein
MVKHEGHILLESCGDDDAENNVEEVNVVISKCLPLVYDTRDIVDVEGISAANVVGDLACDGNHRGGVEQRSDDVGGTGPRGDDADPNVLHECATSVGKVVVGTVALQQLNEDVVAFAWVGAAPGPQWDCRRRRHQCGGGHHGAHDGVGAATVTAMWRRRAATPVSAVIAAEDVRSMVVVAVSEAADLPHGSAVVTTWYSTVAMRSVATARAWSGGSMQRRYM